jgi:hypothetical protein
MVERENKKAAVLKRYEQPQLVRYGTLRELTQELGCHTNKDGSSNSVCRRSP